MRAQAGRYGTLAVFCATAMLVGCRNHDFPDYPAGYHEFAYVTNGGNNTVSVFDVINLRLDRQLQVGQNPSQSLRRTPRRRQDLHQ